MYYWCKVKKYMFSFYKLCVVKMDTVSKMETQTNDDRACLWLAILGLSFIFGRIGLE